MLNNLLILVDWLNNLLSGFGNLGETVKFILITILAVMVIKYIIGPILNGIFR